MSSRQAGGSGQGEGEEGKDLIPNLPDLPNKVMRCAESLLNFDKLLTGSL